MKLFYPAIAIFLNFFCLANTIAQPGNSKIRYQQYDTIITPDNGKQQVRILYKSGNIKELYNLVNGKKNGFEQNFSKDSVLLLSANYKNGLLCGEYLTYDFDGSLNEKRNYTCNVTLNRSFLSGPYERYNRKVLLVKGNYKDSLKEGKFYEYQNTGKLKSVANYHNNLMEGEWLQYNNNNILISKTNNIIIKDSGILKSVLHGKAYYYSYTGILVKEGEYIKGNKEGLWKEYDQQGNLSKEMFYRKNKIYGIYNGYNTNGTLSYKSTYYEEIEVNGKKLKNVYDGLREVYESNGKPESVVRYKMGKRNGPSISYSDNGKIKHENNFENDLASGKEIYYDSDGNRSLEMNYKIFMQDSLAVSLKDGPQLNWKNNILIEESNYTKGKTNGIAKSYYPSGKLGASKYFLDDIPFGNWIEYYENGQIKDDRNYDTISTLPGKKYRQSGWRYTWDEEGKLASKILYDPFDNILVQRNYNKGVSALYRLANIIELNYFPNGKLMSEKVDEYNVALSWHYYLNSKLRKIIFPNATNLVANKIEFFANGQLNYIASDNYNNSDTLLPDDNTLNEILNASWDHYKEESFYTDSIKNGKYKLTYKNGTPFAELNFTQDVPNGDFLFFHPVTNDTMLFARFSNGTRNGPWLQKYGGKTEWRRGNYFNGKQAGRWINNNISGSPYENKVYDSLTGQTIAYETYYNGKLKQVEDMKLGTYSSYDTSGLITSKTELVSPALKRSLQYFPDTRTVKSEIYMRNSLQDSISVYYFPSGKEQKRFYYKKGKREGPYIEYDEAGNINKQGRYEKDELQGLFTIATKTGTDSLYYKNGKLQVKPESFSCACIDTTYSGSKLKFAPSLESLLEYDNLMAKTGKYLLPVDSLNYHSLFYISHQFSNGFKEGFTSLELLMYKEFAVRLPASGEIKLVFNPCITKGYISKMEVAVNHSYDKPANTYASFGPKRIALEFLGGPVKSNTIDHPHFKAFFDCKSVDYNYVNKLKIKTQNPLQDCFVPAVINNIMQLKVLEAQPCIFEDMLHHPLYKPELNLNENEVNTFFGVIATKSEVLLSVATSTGNKILDLNSDYTMLGGKFAAGTLNIKCKLLDNDRYELQDKLKGTIITSQELKNSFLKAGFSRVTLQFDESKKALQITFFTE